MSRLILHPVSLPYALQPIIAKRSSGQHTLSLVSSHHNRAAGEKTGIKLAADRVVAFRHE